MATQANTSVAATDPYVSLTADDARREVLRSICRRYKGKDSIIDARIDAAAARIMGSELAKMVPGERKGANKVPLYFEGEPGVGKTSLIRGAIAEFCEITGLNLVENPADDYAIKPDDFYYCTVNLSGKQNTSDFGGMPFRTEAQISESLRARKKASNVGSLVATDVISSARAIANYDGMKLGEVKSYDEGQMSVCEFTLAGDTAKASKAIECILRAVGEEAKKQGIGIGMLRTNEEAPQDRVSYSIKSGTAGVRVYLHAPKLMDERMEYVTAALPNLRFHLAKHARFALFNFDDVANASENIRNVLLEVAQSGRYSGTMDIGDAQMTFTGNIGSEDNTNVMSKQSDAEVTRIRKFRIYDTPDDWAKRITKKYNASAVADCHMASFIKRQGGQEGIFREPSGAGRGKRGVPKTNSRALENALTVIDGWFLSAHDSGVSPAMYVDQIQSDVAACAGKRVAMAYQAHLVSMLTEAIPLADACIKTGKLDDKKFESHAGSFIQSSQQDFGFRFAFALADSATNKIFDLVKLGRDAGNEVDYKKVGDVFGKMCFGLAALKADMMNASLSRFAARLSDVQELGVDSVIGRRLNTPLTLAFANEIGASLANGSIWPDPEAAEKDLMKVLLGDNAIRSTIPSKAKP